MDPKKIMAVSSISLAVFLAGHLLLCSKKDNGPTGPSYINPSALNGTWGLGRMDVDLYLTTKTGQTAIDFYNQATGTITVTGACTTSLNYFSPTIFPFVKVIASNLSALEDPKPYPNYSFVILETNTLSMAVFNINLDSTTVDSFYVIGPDYQFDSTSYTLQVSDLKLSDLTGTRKVTLNGSLTARVVQVPALTQTYVTTLEDTSLVDGTDTVSFAQDSTFYRIQGNTAGAETTSGTWELSNNNLIMVVIDTVFATIVTDTSAYSVTLNGNQLTAKEDEYRDFTEIAGLPYSVLELLLNLEQDSIDSAVVNVNYILNRK